MTEDQILRVEDFAPYKQGCGPVFRLTVWEAHRKMSMYKVYLGYKLEQSTDFEELPSITLFEGEDFSPSILDAIDSDDMVKALMGFLCLRPGDTDSEYFEDYTEEQLEFCGLHAETLGYFVETLFDEAEEE